MTLGNKIVKRMKVLSLGACSTRHATYINICSKLVQVLVMNMCTLHLRYLDQVDDRVFISANL